MTETKRETRWGWLAILALGVGVVYLGRSILIPFLIAFLLAYAFDPVVRFLERRGIGRFFAIWFVFTVIAAAFVLFLLVVIPIIQEEITRALVQIPGYLEHIRTDFLPYLERRFGVNIPKSYEEILPRLRE